MRTCRPPRSRWRSAFSSTISPAAVAGANSEVTLIALNAARAMAEGGAGSSVVFGHRMSLPAPLAAMVNGTAAHALELDDFGGCGHSGAVVMPVVLALAARGRVSGKAALTALLAGYDLAARVLEGAGGYRPHNEKGWHSTGTCGRLRCGGRRREAARARCGTLRRCARHRRHLHGRHLGLPRRWRDDQAFSSRPGGRETGSPRPFSRNRA